MTLPNDIVRRIASEFAADRIAVATEILESCAELKESARVQRCVVHLARGDLDKLREYAHAAEVDYRDVIWWAEYDGGETVLRDLNQPFAD